jgi:ABC-type glycerol-3-phosphate transport system permease component
MNTSTNVARGFQTSDEARQQAARRHKQLARLRRLAVSAILYIVLLIGSVAFLIPFVWMLTTSLKSQSEVMLLPIRWIPQPLT